MSKNENQSDILNKRQLKNYDIKEIIIEYDDCEEEDNEINENKRKSASFKDNSYKNIQNSSDDDNLMNELIVQKDEDFINHLKIDQEEKSFSLTAEQNKEKVVFYNKEGKIVKRIKRKKHFHSNIENETTKNYIDIETNTTQQLVDIENNATKELVDVEIQVMKTNEIESEIINLFIKDINKNNSNNINNNEINEEWEKMKIDEIKLAAHNERLNIENMKLTNDNEQLNNSNLQLTTVNQQIKDFIDNNIPIAKDNKVLQTNTTQTTNEDLEKHNKMKTENLSKRLQTLKENHERLENNNKRLKNNNLQLTTDNEQLKADNEQLKTNIIELSNENQQLKKIVIITTTETEDFLDFDIYMNIDSNNDNNDDDYNIKKKTLQRSMMTPSIKHHY